MHLLAAPTPSNDWWQVPLNWISMEHLKETQDQQDMEVQSGIQKEMWSTYSGGTSENTNNMVELEGLVSGLKLELQQQWTPLVVDGDSLVIISIVLKIQQGSTIT